MEIGNKATTRHPELLDVLFSYKSKTAAVFKDVLGLHGIDHIAIAFLNTQMQLLTISSTPALEFNLFNSPLWQFDNTYQWPWIALCSHATWPTLYTTKYYDELYAIKQHRYQYTAGLSIATTHTDAPVVYSFASRASATFDNTTAQLQDCHKISLYCMQALQSIFLRYDEEK